MKPLTTEEALALIARTPDAGMQALARHWDISGHWNYNVPAADWRAALTEHVFNVRGLVDIEHQLFAPPDDDIAIDEALSAACKVIQDHVGQKDGDYAARHFADGTRHYTMFAAIMRAYVAAERRIMGKRT